MSVYESRYFQFPDFRVVRVRGREQLRDYEEDPASTEVQVVPVDAIVIRRDELPKVRTEPTAHTAHVGDAVYWHRDVTEASLRSAALNNLAMAEYLREHPPVDEEQVDAIAKALGEAQQNRPFPQQLSDRELREEAHLLVRQGVRVEAKS